jgi:SHS family lactate transporter-like MFS transporter
MTVSYQCPADQAGHREERDRRNAFIAALLGWTMDAFDYFLVIFVLSDIQADRSFGPSASFIIPATLAARPVGAALFGLWSDRVGRRIPLIVDVLLFSCAGVLSAIAPNLTVLLILRTLFGLGMGGEWGTGAALAMEQVPAARRGLLSGILQAGYPIGYLLAALAYLLVNRFLGLNWRWIFVLSILPAIVALIVRSRVTESGGKAGPRRRAAAWSLAPPLWRRREVIARFFYLILLMTAFSWISHSTQDLYPEFLRSTPVHPPISGGAGLGKSEAAWIAVLYNAGAVLGSLLFGACSGRLGRRRTIVLAAMLCLPVVPLYAFTGHGTARLAVGAFLVMLLVQGAWGVIPAHLNELSPAEIRGFYPGVTYQLGNLIASLAVPLQDKIGGRYGYPDALFWTVVPGLLAVIILTAPGPEAQGALLDGGQPGDPDE